MKKYILATCFSFLITGACLADDADCPAIPEDEITSFLKEIKNAQSHGERYTFAFKGKHWFIDDLSRNSILESNVSKHNKTHITKITFLDSDHTERTDEKGRHWMYYRCFYKQKREFNYYPGEYREPDPQFRITHRVLITTKK